MKPGFHPDSLFSVPGALYLLIRPAEDRSKNQTPSLSDHESSPDSSCVGFSFLPWKRIFNNSQSILQSKTVSVQLPVKWKWLILVSGSTVRLQNSDLQRKKKIFLRSDLSSLIAGVSSALTPCWRLTRPWCLKRGTLPPSSIPLVGLTLGPSPHPFAFGWQLREDPVLLGPAPNL